MITKSVQCASTTIYMLCENFAKQRYALQAHATSIALRSRCWSRHARGNGKLSLLAPSIFTNHPSLQSDDIFLALKMASELQVFIFDFGQIPQRDNFRNIRTALNWNFQSPDSGRNSIDHFRWRETFPRLIMLSACATSPGNIPRRTRSDDGNAGM